jgi:excisionase family DNA binding protein
MTDNGSPEPLLLTTREAAALAGCSRARLLKAAYQGEIAVVRYSVRTFRYYRRDVLKWMRAHRREPFKLPPPGFARNQKEIVSQ